MASFYDPVLLCSPFRLAPPGAVGSGGKNNSITPDDQRHTFSGPHLASHDTIPGNSSSHRERTCSSLRAFSVSRSPAQSHSWLRTICLQLHEAAFRKSAPGTLEGETETVPPELQPLRVFHYPPCGRALRPSRNALSGNSVWWRQCASTHLSDLFRRTRLRNPIAAVPHTLSAAPGLVALSSSPHRDTVACGAAIQYLIRWFS